MTEEEMQRKMEFIVEQQAQLVSNQIKFEERSTSHELRMKRIEDELERVTGLVGALAVAQAHTDVQIANLTETATETDDRLNNLIAVVERYIAERRNGES